jgi:hypothetical protein
MTNKWLTRSDARVHAREEHGIELGPNFFANKGREGPPYIQLGGNRCLYSKEDLDRWLEERLSRKIGNR